MAQTGPPRLKSKLVAGPPHLRPPGIAATQLSMLSQFLFDVGRGCDKFAAHPHGVRAVAPVDMVTTHGQHFPQPSDGYLGAAAEVNPRLGVIDRVYNHAGLVGRDVVAVDGDPEPTQMRDRVVRAVALFHLHPVQVIHPLVFLALQIELAVEHEAHRSLLKNPSARRPARLFEDQAAAPVPSRGSGSLDPVPRATSLVITDSGAGSLPTVAAWSTAGLVSSRMLLAGPAPAVAVVRLAVRGRFKLE